ncbi:MAG: hypothetical protein J5907_06690 [Bacteroidales bacterium]|nr:hypothetical protein [Bacteroidales bacterium]
MRKATILFPVAVAALLLLLLPACSTKEEILEEATYSIEIAAVKGSAETRALALNGNVLNAPWEAGDKVYVYRMSPSPSVGYEQVGILFATSSGNSTTLTGKLTGIFYKGDYLLFSYLHELSFKYTGQDGSLGYIASNCDYAFASQQLKEIGSGTISFAGDLSFESMQSIVKFTLKDQDGNLLTANKLSLRLLYESDGNENDVLAQSFEPLVASASENGGFQFGPLDVIPESPSSEFYVALMCTVQSGKLVLSASSNDSEYTYTIETFTIQPDNYYLCDVKMTKQE